MNLALLLEMGADVSPTRVVLGTRSDGLTAGQLLSASRRVGAFLAGMPGGRVGLVDLNSAAVPLALFGTTVSGKTFVPMSYRLTDTQLRDLVGRTAPATLIAGEGVESRIGPVDGIRYVSRKELLEVAADETRPANQTSGPDADAVAVLLYTSGTTGDPKGAVLRQRNLTSYVLSTVELASASDDEAALVSVPPYHVAGVSAVLTSVYAGRRLVYLEQFEPAAWVATVREEGVTHAMVVPTMLGRILEVLGDGEGLPTLRHLSYGGGPMPPTVIERALAALPHVAFVNAYGLTETSSTISLLGPEEHREAVASSDAGVRSRLRSVGRPLPHLSVAVRGPLGEDLGRGESGEIWVRGEQVSGEYLGQSGVTADGWFRTRDEGHLDEFGYLYLHGRLDDVIVRGGENLSPGAIEAALMAHPAVLDAVVVGLPDDEWGEKVVAVVALGEGATATEEQLRAFVRRRLRSTQTPERIAIKKSLPYNETGKVLRRVVRDMLAETFGSSASP